MRNPLLTIRFENEILELIDNRDQYTRSDLQGRVEAIVNGIMSDKRILYKKMFEESLRHNTELGYENAVEYIRAIGSYNEFEANKVIEMLDEIDELIPRAYYNEGNPNNGKRNYSIRVGRESSPVMYIVLYSWKSTDGIEQIKELEAKEHEFEQIALKIGLADEFFMSHKESHYGYYGLEMRIWWD